MQKGPSVIPTSVRLSSQCSPVQPFSPTNAAAIVSEGQQQRENRKLRNKPERNAGKSQNPDGTEPRAEQCPHSCISDSYNVTFQIQSKLHRRGGDFQRGAGRINQQTLFKQGLLNYIVTGPKSALSAVSVTSHK